MELTLLGGGVCQGGGVVCPCLGEKETGCRQENHCSEKEGGLAVTWDKGSRKR